MVTAAHGTRDSGRVTPSSKTFHVTEDRKRTVVECQPSRWRCWEQWVAALDRRRRRRCTLTQPQLKAMLSTPTFGLAPPPCKEWDIRRRRNAVVNRGVGQRSLTCWTKRNKSNYFTSAFQPAHFRAHPN
ncbi:hypothetical protein EVAR_89451_1 [Eumeta japonica]|uniref:Uncharacterized protein n=1 Tax=Eumeta variegata TaxID=151549 RepID=A0A4C1Z498_EUMVA|nr:hypothetical protein EVAR_89451_1 [Eumeta japonica]